MLSLEENKAIIRRWYDAENAKDLSSIEDIVASDCVDHAHQLQGVEAYKQYIVAFAQGFPDFHETIEDLIAEGDKVWVRFTFTGTHTGEYRGVAPTGKKVTAEIVDIFRIVDGKVVEWWEVADALKMSKQLGLIEYTETGKHLLPQDAS